MFHSAMSVSEYICTHSEFDPMAELNRQATICMTDNSTGNKRNSK